MLYDFPTFEPPHDLKGDMSSVACHAAIEFDGHRLNTVQYKDAIEKLNMQLEELVAYAEGEISKTDNGAYWFYGFQPSALNSLDAVWMKRKGIEPYKFKTREEQTVAIKEAIERITEMRKTIEKGIYIILTPEEYLDLAQLCVEISRAVSGYTSYMLRSMLESRELGVVRVG